MSSGEAPLEWAGTGGHWVWPLLPGLLAAGTQPQGAEDLQALDDNRLELDRQGSVVGPRPSADVLTDNGSGIKHDLLERNSVQRHMYPPSFCLAHTLHWVIFEIFYSGRMYVT